MFCGDPVTVVYAPCANTTYIKTSQGSYTSGIDPKVGYESLTSSTYRKALQFDLNNIPASAKILHCEINYLAGYECGSQDGTIRFTQIPFEWPTYLFEYKKVYDSIGYGAVIGYQSINLEQIYTLSLPSFVPVIQNAIQSPYKFVALGSYNQYEAAGYGTSFQNVQLIIVYKLPTPSAPLNLRVVPNSITSGSLILAWDAPGGEVTGYKVYKNGVLYDSTSNTSMQICNLYPGSSYSFYVRAYNSYGDGNPSSTITQQTLPSSISGADLFCTSGSYSVHNVPPGSTITWNEPWNMILISDPHSNPVEYQKRMNGNGSVIATISSGCENYDLSKYVHTGPYSSSDYPVSGPGSAQCYSNVYYSIPQLSGVTSINWTWPVGWTYVSGQNSRYLQLRTGRYSGMVGVGVNNICGPSGSYATFYTSVYGCYGLYIVLTPNPASEEVNITLKETEDSVSSNDTLSINDNVTEETQGYRILITDSMGVIYYNGIKYEKSFILPLRNLKNGNYIVVVESGKEKCSATLIVSH